MTAAMKPGRRHGKWIRPNTERGGFSIIVTVEYFPTACAVLRQNGRCCNLSPVVPIDRLETRKVLLMRQMLCGVIVAFNTILADASPAADAEPET